LIKELIHLIQKSEKLLNERHVLIFRLNKILLELVHKKISGDEPSEENQKEKTEEEEKEYLEYLIIYIKAAYSLYLTQVLMYHKDHIDLATTYNDLEMSISTLLSQNQKLFYATFPQWNSFTKASKFQQTVKLEFERIVKLYE
jgi:hypothetical protein